MGRHCSTCRCGKSHHAPDHEKIMKNFERERPKYKEVNGAFYKKEVPDEVVRVLEDCRSRDVAVQIYSGYTEIYGPEHYPESKKTIGEDWLEEFDCQGQVHLTMGPLKSPILVPRGADGGMLISGETIVRIRQIRTDRDLYRHPKYHQPMLKMGPVDNTMKGPTMVEAVYANGDLHAQFTHVGDAAKWAWKHGWVLLQGE